MTLRSSLSTPSTRFQPQNCATSAAARNRRPCERFARLAGSSPGHLCPHEVKESDKDNALMEGLPENINAGFDQAASIGLPPPDILAAISADLKATGNSSRGLGNSDTQFQSFSPSSGGGRGGDSSRSWIIARFCSIPWSSTHLKSSRLLWC